MKELRIRIIKRIFQAIITLKNKKILHISKIILYILKIQFTVDIYVCRCKTCTVTTEEQKRLEALEMRGYGTMLKINWIDRITIKKVLERISEENLLWKNIVIRRNGHTIRHERLL